ncbi:MAG TPA: ZIP family metal transporter [Acidimicrobiales bacterium]|nr:ZIP family metal transporter [Acidimicrobiales bacterium]
MSPLKTILLGAVAGGTIFVGMPVGRLRRPHLQLRAFLSAVAIGVLVFILYDVIQHGLDPISADIAPTSGAHHQALAKAAGLGVLFAAGLAAGLLGLVGVDRWLVRRRPLEGPGAVVAGASDARAPARSRSHELALFIAMGIGLHNFAEGLAIGQSAARGAIGFAVVLVVGFALHNATEGFGIVAPMAGDEGRPSWNFLLLMGLLGGGPTIVGTAVGRGFSSDAVSVVFLALAAGSILYVVVQLVSIAARSGYRQTLLHGILVGLLLGIITDLVVTAGGV